MTGTEPAAERGGLVTRTSLARGKAMSPGIQAAPFYWRDVVTGPPPHRRVRGDALHVTFHGTDDEGDVRVSISTIVRVDPGANIDSALDDVIHVEERLNLQRRTLQELIDRERAFSDRLALRWRSRLARALVAQRRAANRVNVSWIVTTMVWLIRLQAKVGNAAIRGTRSFLRGLVVVPDFVLARSGTAAVHLGSRSGRRDVWRATLDPASASPAEKSIVLVLISFSLVGLVLLANATLPPFLPFYYETLADFTTSLLSTIALPIPAEPLFIQRVIRWGVLVGIVGPFLGKMVGSWMLYLLGDSLNDGIQQKTAKKPRLARLVAWMQRNADRWGFWILIPINAIPFLPDLLVYVFAVSGMRFRSFMGGIAVGTLVKFVAIALGIYFVGSDAVAGFLEHPIQTLRGA